MKLEWEANKGRADGEREYWKSAKKAAEASTAWLDAVKRIQII